MSATYRIYAEAPNRRVIVAKAGRSDLVIHHDDRDNNGFIAHVIAGTLHWENDQSIQIFGCDCAGDHEWDTDR